MNCRSSTSPYSRLAMSNFFWKKKSEFSSLQFNFLFLLVICKCTCLNPPSKTLPMFAWRFLCHLDKSLRVLFWQSSGWSSGVCTVSSKENFSVWTQKDRKKKKAVVIAIWHSSNHYLPLISSNLCIAACFLSSLEVELISAGECVIIWHQEASRDVLGRDAGVKRLAGWA